MTLKISEVKSRNTRMIARLKQLGINIKHTQGLEGLAAAENFSDWNKYEAYLHKHNTARLQTETDVSKQPRFIAVHPGSGKTTCLQMLVADCISNGKTALYIDCSTGTFERMPTFLQKQCTVFSGKQLIEHGNNKHSKLDLGDKPFKLVEMDFGVSYADSNKVYDLIRLLKYVKNAIAGGSLINIGLIVLDEFHRLSIQNDFVMQFLVPEFIELGAPLVIGSQLLPNNLPNDGLQWRITTTKDLKSECCGNEVLNYSYMYLDECTSEPPSFDDADRLPEAFAAYVYMHVRRIKYPNTLGSKKPLLDMFSEYYQSESHHTVCSKYQG